MRSSVSSSPFKVLKVLFLLCPGLTYLGELKAAGPVQLLLCTCADQGLYPRCLCIRTLVEKVPLKNSVACSRRDFYLKSCLLLLHVHFSLFFFLHHDFPFIHVSSVILNTSYIPNTLLDPEDRVLKIYSSPSNSLLPSIILGVLNVCKMSPLLFITTGRVLIL